MKILLSLAAFLFAINASILAQQPQGHPYSVKKIKSFEPRNVKADFLPNLQSLEAPSPDGDSYRSYLLRLKKEIAERYPLRNARSGQNSDPSLNPVLERDFGSFNGPNMDRINPGGTPNDNTLAVSNDGILISAYNTRIYFHDLKADTPLYRPNPYVSVISFVEFAEQNDSVATDGPFDPKLLYDEEADRFVLVFLSGRTPDDSKNIVAFSSTNNPMDKWHVYEITGNPKGNRTWTDYPAIALTKDELFLTVNLLRENEPWQTGFEESIVWQMDKSAGYTGADSLPAKWWGNINFGPKAIRNLHPIQGGKSLTSPDLWLLSNRNFDVQNDTIFMVHITGTLADATATVEIKYGLSDQAYGAPANARQANDHYFDTNDGRVLGAFIDGKYVQFVANSIDTSTGQSAVYHGIIEDITAANPAVDGQIIAHSSYDIGYPNIAATGIANGDYSSIIGFDHSSPTVNAGFSAVYYDGNNSYSEIIKVIEGEGYVDILRDQSGDRRYERWGDYFGIQRRYDDPRKVWMCGYYGLANNGTSHWIAELSTHDHIASNSERELESRPVLYPNPSHDYVNVKFNNKLKEKVEFELFDLNGKRIKILSQDYLHKGLHQFSFATHSLEPGTYILQIKGQKDILHTEKFQVR